MFAIMSRVTRPVGKGRISRREDCKGSEDPCSGDKQQVVLQGCIWPGCKAAEVWVREMRD